MLLDLRTYLPKNLTSYVNAPFYHNWKMRICLIKKERIYSDFRLIFNWHSQCLISLFEQLQSKSRVSKLYLQSNFSINIFFSFLPCSKGTVYILGQYTLIFSYVVVHFFLSGCSGAEIKCTVHVALPKWPINR